MKKLFLIIIFISSCARQEIVDSKFNESINFNNDYTKSEFINFIEMYNDINGYPDINK